MASRNVSYTTTTLDSLMIWNQSWTIFGCVTNVTKAHIRLPPSLKHNEGVRQCAACVIETMEGKGTLAKLKEFALGDYLLLGDRNRMAYTRTHYTARNSRPFTQASRRIGLEYGNPCD